MSEIAKLRAERDALQERIVFLQAEADVLNGTACAEEQRNGNGPCGACSTCYRGMLAAAVQRAERAESECARLLRIEDAAAEVSLVAQMRGETIIDPITDPLCWSARMQSAWDELADALSVRATPPRNPAA
jgi:hypothetical protein